MKKESVLEYDNVRHTFEPIWNVDSKILILGTFPSVKSRKNNFYYGNPQNRFWKVVAKVLGCAEPMSIEEKKKMLIDSGIAIWDVIESCDIIGSSDNSIRNVPANDIERLVSLSEIRKIYANGNKAAELYRKYVKTSAEIELITLPSTSPANASYSLDRLFTEWKKILNDLS